MSTELSIIEHTLLDAQKAVRVLFTMLTKEKLKGGVMVADEILGSISEALKQVAHLRSADRLDAVAVSDARLETAKGAEPPSPGWQPISAAPKDDKVCVLGWAESRYRDGYQRVIMRWFNNAGDPQRGFWVCNAMQYYPTHWMPLPQPPEPKP